MRLYNTLTGKKEAFVPQQAKHVNMYVCGPTVYDVPHIGNIRTAVVFDALRRFLEYKGNSVTKLVNLTDVDDKIIQRAIEEGVSSNLIADRYIAEALKDYESLMIRRADLYPRPTEEMNEIIQMISQLVKAGYAYEREGNVFFDARKFEGYGKLSKKNIDDLLAGARIEVNDLKKSPVDFVLWKPYKSGEPYWESPWGNGRPGWHIECSAMVKKYLSHVDIHGGGSDLIFPHHENEIAQSEALQDGPFVHYWMHVGMLTNNHKKMSKSLGNFTTLRQTAEKFPHEVIRFFLLSGHYRMPMEYSEELLESARRAFERIKNCRHLLEEAIADGADGATDADFVHEAKAYFEDFIASLEDDFNTADAISVIFELVRAVNTRAHKAALPKAFAEQMLEVMNNMCELLGLGFAAVNEDVDTGEIETLIAQRQEARKNKNWAEADKIREDLTERGIILEDTAAGVRWTRK